MLTFETIFLVHEVVYPNFVRCSCLLNEAILCDFIVPMQYNHNKIEYNTWSFAEPTNEKGIESAILLMFILDLNV